MVAVSLHVRVVFHEMYEAYQSGQVLRVELNPVEVSSGEGVGQCWHACWYTSVEQCRG